MAAKRRRDRDGSGGAQFEQRKPVPHVPREYMTAKQIYERRRRDVEDAQGQHRPYLSGTLPAAYVHFMWAMLSVPGTSRPRLGLREAAAALAQDRRFLSSGFSNPLVRSALCGLGTQGGRDVIERVLRSEIFPEALCRAVARRNVPRRIRLNRYLKDRAGRVLAFTPESLPIVGEFFNWLRMEAHRIAEDLLVRFLTDGDANPRRREPHRSWSNNRPGGDLERLLAAGDPAARRRLFAYLDTLNVSDQGRTVLLLYAQGASHAEIAHRLGPTMRPGAVRTAFSRLPAPLKCAARAIRVARTTRHEEGECGARIIQGRRVTGWPTG